MCRLQRGESKSTVRPLLCLCSHRDNCFVRVKLAIWYRSLLHILHFEWMSRTLNVISLLSNQDKNLLATQISDSEKQIFPRNYKTFEWLGVLQVTKFDVGLVTILNVFLSFIPHRTFRLEWLNFLFILFNFPSRTVGFQIIAAEQPKAAKTDKTRSLPRMGDNGIRRRQ